MSFIHVRNITWVLTICHKGRFCLPPQLADSISNFVFIQSSQFTLQINLSSLALYRSHVIPQRGVEKGRFFNGARSSQQFLRDYLPLYLNANAGPTQRMLFIRTPARLAVDTEPLWRHFLSATQSTRPPRIFGARPHAVATRVFIILSPVMCQSREWPSTQCSADPAVWPVTTADQLTHCCLIPASYQEIYVYC